MFYLPGLSLEAPADNLIYTAPATVNFSARAWQLAFDEYVARGGFLCHGLARREAGTGWDGQNAAAGTNLFTFTWTNDVLGTLRLTAVARDNLGGATTSASVTMTVIRRYW